jgi:hypothetical protein
VLGEAEPLEEGRHSGRVRHRKQAQVLRGRGRNPRSKR